MRFSKRENLFFILISILALVGVGYAYLNTNLNISGIANLEKPTWNVYFDNVQITEGSVTTVTQSPTIDSNKTTITYNITLDKPGDFYEFTVDVKNDGTIDAMIEEVVSRVNGVAPGELPSYLKYSATYDNGSEILNNQLLLANQTKTYRIRIEYDSDISPNDLPQEDQSYVISFGTPFIQKSGDGEDSDYVVSFNANGGEGEMTNQIIMAHTPTALKKNTFTKEGYLFKGWNTKCDGTGTSYYDEQEVTDLGEVTLCAQWKIDAFPYVFRQDGVCTFNGSGNNITGNDCSDYANNKYIDTGVKLYSSTNINKDYEIGFTIEEYVPENNVDQATLMNTKNEASGYPGVVFRKQSNTEFELASRKTSSVNEFYRFASSGVRNVKIYRINGEIFYKIDDGEKTFLNNLTQYNPTFDLNVWFGAGPTNASATTAQRYFVGKLSNMYIRLGTYVDSSIYTIELNPNGGNVEPSSISVGEGNAIGELPTPTRDLYDFDGWYTGLTDGVEVDSTYIPDGDMTLFARWTKKPTYTVTFNSNGGSNIEDMEILQGEQVGELPTPENAGKIFAGWFTSLEGGTKVNSTYVPSDDITLYAHWIDTTFPTVFEQIGSCTFNGSDSNISGEDCEDYNNQKYIDTGISLYSEENKSKDYEIGFTIESYTPSQNTSRATLMNTKLEATGYPGVVFRRDESTNNFILQSRKTSSANEQLTFAYNTITSVKIYRISDEIYYSINGGEKVLLNNLSQYNPTFNLTAWFGAAPANEEGTSVQRYFKGTLSNMYIKLGTYDSGKYRITFDTNGGNALTPGYIDINKGDNLGTLPTLEEREWYTFDGWYTDLTGGIEIDENYIPNSDITIYARWTEIPSYLITFDSNGGNEVSDRRIVQGTAIGELPILEEREWYTFDGWYTDLTGGTKVNDNYVPDHNATIYAHWTEIPSYTIIFDSNGGTTIPNKRIVQGDPIGTLMTPTKTMGVFDGWYTGLIDGIKIDENYVPNSNATIYARWTEYEHTLYNVLKREAAIGTYALEYTGNHQDSMAGAGDEKIYYWYAPSGTEGNALATEILDKNNVIFAGYCWQMIRTTDTGGVKMIYNGVVSDGKCNNTGTAQQIQTTTFHDSSTVFRVGYMYNKDYEQLKKELISTNSYLHENYTVLGYTVNSSSNVVWNGSRWVLENPTSTYGQNLRYKYAYLGGRLAYVYKCSNEYNYNYGGLPDYDIYYYVSLDSSLSNLNFVYGDTYTKNNDGTYTINNPTSMEIKDYYSSYSNLKNKFLCTNAVDNTCSDLWYVYSATSPSMYYVPVESEYKFASDYTYEDGKYKLNNDTVSFWDVLSSSNKESLNSHHYTCLDMSDECNELYYVYKYDITVSTQPKATMYYVKLENGNDIESIKRDILNSDSINLNDSVIKTKIETWYQDNLISNSDKIEETIYCNDRSISDQGGWDPNGGNVSNYMYLNGSNDLTCPNVTDRFSVDNPKARLSYSIGLITKNELSLLTNVNLKKTGSYYWIGTPGTPSTNYYVNSSGAYSTMSPTNSRGVRPVISLKPNTAFVSGDGSKDEPYVVE